MIVSMSGVRSIFGEPLVLGLRVVWSPTGRRVIASSAFIIGSSLSGTDGRVVWTARFLAVMLSLNRCMLDSWFFVVVRFEHRRQRILVTHARLSRIAHVCAQSSSLSTKEKSWMAGSNWIDLRSAARGPCQLVIRRTGEDWQLFQVRIQ